MIKVDALNHHYQEQSILKDIHLHIHAGECVILKGISGSGKTTLLSLIAGLERPSSGQIFVDKEPIAKLADNFASSLRATKIGMVFQHFNLLDHLSVSQNIMLPLIPHIAKQSQISTQVEEAMQLAHISHKSDALCALLSGGEKQRTAIARALVAKPSILLCDEPTANLDKSNTEYFIQTLHTLHKAGKTIVIATHDPLFDTLPFKSRIIPLVNGEICYG